MSTNPTFSDAKQLFENFITALEAEKAETAAAIEDIKNRISALEGQGAPAPSPAPAPNEEVKPDIFQKGTVYPRASVVQLPSNFTVPPGTTTVVVPVTLDQPSPNTVIAYLRCSNGSGIDYGRVIKDFTQSVIFQPGETEKTLSFNVYTMKEANHVQVSHANVPDGGDRSLSSIRVTATAGAVAVAPIIDAPLPTFEPHGNLVYNQSGREVLQNKMWLDRLAHGRSQAANRETGYYAPNNFNIEGDDLILRSFRAATPFTEGTPQISYPFAASVLTGLKDVGDGWPDVRPELSFKYGSIEWEAKMPNRVGSWPALWLLSHRSGDPKWPFEIDVFEGFYYDPSHRPGRDLSANLHGGAEGSSIRNWIRDMRRLSITRIGGAATLDTEFHKYACTITPEFIKVFVDGTLSMAWQNPFTSTDGWYPIMNVAVKANPDSLYNLGSGDMTIRRVKIWRQS